jgi:hypothetical protein
MRRSHAIAPFLLLSGVIADTYVYADARVKPCSPHTPQLVSTDGPDLVPPATEFRPHGWANLNLTIAKSGKVISVAVGEWHIEPDQDWLHAQVLSWARRLVFRPVDSQCVYVFPVKLKLTDDDA